MIQIFMGGREQAVPLLKFQKGLLPLQSRSGRGTRVIAQLQPRNMRRESVFHSHQDAQNLHKLLIGNDIAVDICRFGISLHDIGIVNAVLFGNLIID